MPSDGTHPNTTSDILLAGAFAAFTVDLLIYPLDTLKTRLQSSSYQQRFANASTRHMFRGLYQGVGSVILATLPSSGAFFLTYESAKTALAPLAPSVPTPLLYATASAAAELVSCAILTPAEVVKQNAQMSTTSSSLAVLRRFRAKPATLFRGYTALAARNLPFTALQFPLLENTKARIRTYREERGLWTGGVAEQALVTAVAAGSAGALAAVVTTPVDVVKTRVMLGEGKNTNGWNVGKEIWKTEGFKGLFRGGALRGVWTMVGSGLYLGVYDLARVALAKRRGEDIDGEELF